eukprot:Skav234014  [mRNA]  locus=scaffold3484:116676:116933:- [translate_table: standard]
MEVNEEKQRRQANGVLDWLCFEVLKKKKKKKKFFGVFCDSFCAAFSLLQMDNSAFGRLSVAFESPFKARNLEDSCEMGKESADWQ